MKPRTNVRPGSCAKSSSSSAWTWRGASFNCCATASIDQPAAMRASRRRAPAETAATASASRIGTLASPLICKLTRTLPAESPWPRRNSG
jgi:hypothetical protein